ncbi:hypothetical protein OCU04_012636 [Sclerotinia nivalis]|uniref:Uncharacterized protein n=1 Tax=Sclerotinia nivalis TaxID=352851 RepID=A0A9X0AA85_9HELO|nr:hypothetical protein OCU04_012636 [Sclerotinia nivalis]
MKMNQCRRLSPATADESGSVSDSNLDQDSGYNSQSDLEFGESVRVIKGHGYPTIKAAAKTRYFEKHQKIQIEINSLKSQKNKQLLNKTIQKFYKNIHTIEIDRQLQRIQFADILTPPTGGQDSTPVRGVLYEPPALLFNY